MENVEVEVFSILKVQQVHCVYITLLDNINFLLYGILFCYDHCHKSQAGGCMCAKNAGNHQKCFAKLLASLFRCVNKIITIYFSVCRHQKESVYEFWSSRAL